MFLLSSTSLLLPKFSSELKYTYPPARDWGSRASSLVLFTSPPSQLCSIFIYLSFSFCFSFYPLLPLFFSSSSTLFCFSLPSSASTPFPFLFPLMYFFTIATGRMAPIMIYFQLFHCSSLWVLRDFLVKFWSCNHIAPLLRLCSLSALDLQMCIYVRAHEHAHEPGERNTKIVPHLRKKNER